MSNPCFDLSFNSVTKLGDSLLIDELEENLKAYLDWGFLNIGGYINVNIPTSGLYGGSFHKLKSVDTPGYKLGQVWQSAKKDWVWQSGFYFNDGTNNDNTANSISGIYVNNNFLQGPTGVANSGYYINYPLGQIVFDSPISSSANIELNYAYRWCQIYKSSTDPYWKELQELTYKPTSSSFNNAQTKGDYSIGSNHRIQMPAIIIEPIARSFSKGWQLGARDFMISQDLLLHVFTENGSDRNRIMDILRLQKEATVPMYNINKVVNSGVNPLDYHGSINSNGYMYHILADLNSEYYWNSFFIKNIEIIDIESMNSNIFWCTLRITTDTLI